MYEWYFTRGKKSFPHLDYTNPRDIIDVTRNGIFFFTLCNGPVNSFTGSLETFNLFAGGQGAFNYLPIFGNKMPTYQKDANEFFI